MGSEASSYHSSSHHSHRRRRHKSGGRPLLVIHILNTVFSSTSAILFIATIPLWNSNFFHSSGLVKGDWPDCLPLIPLLTTLGISLSNLTKLALGRWRERKSSPDEFVKPKRRSTLVTISRAHAYMTLTILILLLAFLILAGISGLYRYWRAGMMTAGQDYGSAPVTLSLPYLVLRRSMPNTDPVGPALTPPTTLPNPSTSSTPNPPFRSCTLANIFTRRCNPTIYLIGELQIAAIATGGLAWVFNLFLLTLQLREYQYQKRKLQRSLRAKAKARLEHLKEEDELSKSSQSVLTRSKNARSARTQLTESSTISATPPSSMRPHLPSYPETALTSSVGSITRPKQHHYKPSISPSRRTAESEISSSSNLGSLREYSDLYASRCNTAPRQHAGQTQYVKAVEEARRKVKPAETMRDWMAARRV